MTALAVFCADVGSEKKDRFGWAGRTLGVDASEQVIGGSSIGGLVTSVAEQLNGGVPVALGFECPLFVPISEQSMDLLCARDGEGARPWCAGAGSGALATGLVQIVWILREVRRALCRPVPAYVDWRQFSEGTEGLYVWEAFVSQAAKANSHQGDAAVAVEAFVRALPKPMQSNAINAKEVHSLIGAALLRTGWTKSLEALETPCLVVKA